jgi:hypothetical protein
MVAMRSLSRRIAMLSAPLLLASAGAITVAAHADDEPPPP